MAKIVSYSRFVDWGRQPSSQHKVSSQPELSIGLALATPFSVIRVNSTNFHSTPILNSSTGHPRFTSISDVHGNFQNKLWTTRGNVDGDGGRQKTAQQSGWVALDWATEAIRSSVKLSQLALSSCLYIYIYIRCISYFCYWQCFSGTASLNRIEICFNSTIGWALCCRSIIPTRSSSFHFLQIILLDGPRGAASSRQSNSLVYN